MASFAASGMMLSARSFVVLPCHFGRSSRSTALFSSESRNLLEVRVLKLSSSLMIQSTENSG